MPSPDLPENLYAAVDGHENGSGTIDDPLDLDTAISSGRVAPGDTLLLRGGVYFNDYVCSISGTSVLPITIKAYSGEFPIIDGSFKIIGQQIRLQDIEIRNTSWVDRMSSETGSSPSDIIQQFGLSVYNIGCKAINCKIHDTKIGVYIDDAAEDFELYGCLLWDNGWSAPDGGHGHTIYFHGKNRLRTIKNCISMQDFSDYGIHVYNANSIINHVIENNISVARRVIAGSNYGNTGNITIKNNCFYGETLQVGYVVADKTNYGLQIKDNYIAQNISVNNFVDATIQNNVVETGGTLTINYPAVHNEYVLSNTFSATGTDRTVIYQNAYDSDKLNLAVYNYSLSNTVSVDLSGKGLVNGRTYVLRNCQDPLSDTEIFVYNGDNLIIDMTASSHTVSIPFAHNVSLEGKSFPQFGAFLIEKQ